MLSFFFFFTPSLPIKWLIYQPHRLFIVNQEEVDDERVFDKTNLFERVELFTGNYNILSARELWYHLVKHLLKSSRAA